ncbi:MAG: hypothetical protein A2W68_07010 [Betaproteobacteria bacterium RIFCSPLOWO2_02_64_14]|nr:MAG: hypothetical protein A2W68_07010 [Betaproteobacteria bacterium RIFCSPLOWO2_02_64_14]
MHRDPGRFIEREQSVVFIQHRADETARSGATRQRRWARKSRRGDADAVTHTEPIVGADPLAVHPDFAAPQDAVDVALGNALEAPDEVIIDALPGRLLSNLPPEPRIFT